MSNMKTYYSVNKMYCILVEDFTKAAIENVADCAKCNGLVLLEDDHEQTNVPNAFLSFSVPDDGFNEAVFHADLKALGHAVSISRPYSKDGDTGSVHIGHRVEPLTVAGH